MSELARYGIEWRGPKEPIGVPIEDGYWTPWHMAEARIAALEAERDKGERVFQAVVYAYEGRDVPPDLKEHGFVKRARKHIAEQCLQAQVLQRRAEAAEELRNEAEANLTARTQERDEARAGVAKLLVVIERCGRHCDYTDGCGCPTSLTIGEARAVLGLPASDSVMRDAVGALAECYRLTGADPDGNEDWRLAPKAVEEVKALRDRLDAADAQVEQLCGDVRAVSEDYTNELNARRALAKAIAAVAQALEGLPKHWMVLTGAYHSVVMVADLAAIRALIPQLQEHTEDLARRPPTVDS